MIIIKHNLPQYKFQISDVILHFYHLRCFHTVCRTPYRYLSIALKVILHRWRIPPSFVQMSAPKNITRFHHQDAIYLPRLQSLVMVLGVFNLIIKKSETKEETLTEKKEKNNNVLPSHHPLLLLVPISPLRPRTALLAGNSFIVRCHVTSKKPMTAHVVRKKIQLYNTSKCLRVIVQWIIYRFSQR